MHIDVNPARAEHEHTLDRHESERDHEFDNDHDRDHDHHDHDHHDHPPERDPDHGPRRVSSEQLRAALRVLEFNANALSRAGAQARAASSAAVMSSQP